MGADARLTGRAVWDTVTFLLNGFVFIVMGLEVPLLFRALTPARALQLIGIGIAVSLVLVARPRAVDLRHRARAAAACDGTGPAGALRLLGRPLLGGDARRRLARRGAGAAARCRRRAVRRAKRSSS